MAFGASEGLLLKAYGAVDFSGLYKHIDDQVKLAAEQDKLAKAAAAKEYAFISGQLNKDFKNIRYADVDDLNKKRDKWQATAKLKSIHSTNIEDNMDYFAKLSGEESYLYDDVFKDATYSSNMQKELTKVEADIQQDVKSGKNRYKSDALTTIAKLKLMKTSDILAQGLNDWSKLVYDGFNPQTFRKSKEELYSDKNLLHESYVPTYRNDKDGYTVMDKVKIPDYSEKSDALRKIGDMVRGQDGQPNQHATQLIEQLEKEGLWDEKINKWNTMSEDELSKYKTRDANGNYIDMFPPQQIPGTVNGMSRKAFLNFDKSNPVKAATSFLTAEYLLSKKEEVTKESITVFDKGKMGELEARNRLMKKTQMELIDFRDRYKQASESRNYEYKSQLNKEWILLQQKLKASFSVAMVQKKLDVEFGGEYTPEKAAQFGKFMDDIIKDYAEKTPTVPPRYGGSGKSVKSSTENETGSKDSKENKPKKDYPKPSHNLNN